MPCKGCSASIWLMDADGLHARALTSPSESVSDTGPSWSPDGKRIVFHRTSPVTGLDRLYVVSANGAPARALRVIGGPAAWGPKRIAYLSRDGQSIWTATPDGTHPRKLVTARGIGAFAWSRDGRLAYLSGHGTTLNVLGKTRKSFRLPHKAGADGLAWSPDGSRLLFTASAGTTSSDLYSIEANGRHLERLTSNMGDIAGMSWR